MHNTLKQMTAPELQAKLIDNLKKSMDLRFTNSRGNRQVKVHLLRQIRTENARIKTLLTLLEAQQEQES